MDQRRPRWQPRVEMQRLEMRCSRRRGETGVRCSWTTSHQVYAAAVRVRIDNYGGPVEAKVLKLEGHEDCADDYSLYLIGFSFLNCPLLDFFSLIPRYLRGRGLSESPRYTSLFADLPDASCQIIRPSKTFRTPAKTFRTLKNMLNGFFPWEDASGRC